MPRAMELEARASARLRKAAPAPVGAVGVCGQGNGSFPLYFLCTPPQLGEGGEGALNEQNSSLLLRPLVQIEATQKDRDGQLALIRSQREEDAG